MLQVKQLTCVRADRPVFQGLSFDLKASRLMQVVGVNGSGKTSLLRILAGLLKPAEGSVSWRGMPIEQQTSDYSLARVYMGHANALKGDLSAMENLHWACLLAGRDPTQPVIAEALNHWGLNRRHHLPLRVLSQGQQRRAAIARLSLLLDAKLWLLDEPFAALDTEAQEALEHLIARFLDEGGSVILTTHQAFGLSPRITDRVDLDRLRASC